MDTRKELNAAQLIEDLNNLVPNDKSPVALGKEEGELRKRFQDLLKVIHNETDSKIIILQIYNFYKIESRMDSIGILKSRFIEKIEKHLFFLLEVKAQNISSSNHSEKATILHEELLRRRHQLQEKVSDFVGESYKYQIIGLAPSRKESNFYLSQGNAYEAQGKFREAMKHYLQAIELDPTSKPAKGYLKRLFDHATDANLIPMQKTRILDILEKLDDQDQYALLKSCQEKGNPLGDRFWTQEGIKPCKLKKGKLQRVGARIKELEYKIEISVSVVDSGQSFFDNNSVAEINTIQKNVPYLSFSNRSSADMD